MTVIAKSNLTRNVLAHSKYVNNQIVNDSMGLEPMVDICKSMFVDRGYQVIPNKKFSFNGQAGEIDVIVSNETDILFIECKAPLYSTSAFELRGTFDHVLKGGSQLDHIASAMQDVNFRNNFLKQCKIHHKDQRIQTCILMGNRIFSGYNQSSHPIRHIFELHTILKGGYIHGHRKSWRIWNEDKYSHQDLLDYLDSDTSFVNILLNVLKPAHKKLKLGGKTLLFNTFILDAVELQDEYSKVLPEVLQAELSVN